MSKIIIEISFKDFLSLYDFAKIIHAQNEEPIPELNEDNRPKIITALSQPFQTFDGEFLYKGFTKKAAILFYLIIDNHVMNNGNKRMACITLVYFCEINDYPISIPPKTLRSLAKEVASPHDKEQMIQKIQKVIRKYKTVSKRHGFR